jgi:hypothetical protein
MIRTFIVPAQNKKAAVAARRISGRRRRRCPWLSGVTAVSREDRMMKNGGARKCCGATFFALKRRAGSSQRLGRAVALAESCAFGDFYRVCAVR